MLYIEKNYAHFYKNTPNTSSYGPPNDLVEEIKAIVPHGKVLDLGAGDGRHSLYLAALGFEVTAVDISEAGLEKLQQFATKQNLKIKTKLIDLNSWSIDDKYDIIIAIATLQHLRYESALRLLNEMKVQTKNNGVNAITVFTKTGDRYLIDITEDPGAFYVEDNWLKEFYGDWNIIKSGSMTKPLIGKLQPDRSPMLSVVEKILAQKPKQ
jgi:tellurite methyltransferase